MRRRLAAILCLAAIGCSEPVEPHSTQLSPGQECLIGDWPEPDPAPMEVGVKVRVIEDTGYNEVTIPEWGGATARSVTVRVLEGRREGEVHHVLRAQLIPIE